MTLRVLSGMLGLGDNFYQRAVVRELGPVQLITSWPQLYADLPVECIRPDTRLRTQAKNGARTDLPWHRVNRRSLPARRIGYDLQGTMLESMMRSVGLQRTKVNFDGPPVEPRAGRYIVIRPATVRTEWMAAGRNPAPEYLCRAAEALKYRYTIISVADLDGRNEWAVEPVPFAHQTFHRGELLLEDLLSLVAGAAGVVGGVGWLLPMAIAYRVPMLLLYGGWGAANGPQRVLDPRMDASLVEQVFPDRYCLCNDRAHSCDKTISNLDKHLERFTLRLAAREVSAVAA
jgi:hypothetical protein